jgi:iron(III) transport system ATP-binding protein
MTTPFLHCRGLQKRFGDTPAVVDGTLGVERGAITALLGPSGCGKTTMLRLIAGFERPDAGEVVLNGELLSSPSKMVPPEKRRVGFVFQDNALFPHLDVVHNIAFGARRGAGRKAKVREMLTLAGLEGLEKRMPHELSGGQQRRVALARTLAAEPDLVLLDEPFSNLDPTLRARVRNDVWTLIRECRATALMVTHDHEEALSLTGKVAVMLDGRVHQVATAAELYARPANRDVASFIGDANFIRGTASKGVASSVLGTFPVDGDGEGAIDIMVRPEDLVIEDDALVTARVEWAEFYGHDQVVGLRLPGDELVRVRVLGNRVHTPGDEVGVLVRGKPVAYARNGRA